MAVEAQTTNRNRWCDGMCVCVMAAAGVVRGGVFLSAQLRRYGPACAHLACLSEDTVPSPQ